MGKKKDVLLEVFKPCKERGNFIFDNNILRKICDNIGFVNQFDVTKLDDTSKLPKEILENDYFIVHLGKGKHKYLKGVKKGYHNFEIIPPVNIYNWQYNKSVLNESDTSESNMISVAYNQGIIKDFLYKDSSENPKAYNARRTKMSFSYCIGDEKIETDLVQMEVDFTIEYNGVVTIFEGKNNFPTDFAIYQVFHPFKYFSLLKENENLPIKIITCCYILRKKISQNSILKLYNYTFIDDNDLSSIKLLKCAQYNLLEG